MKNATKYKASALPLLCVILSFSVTGCAMQDRDFPSLAKRSIENSDNPVIAAVPQPMAPLPASVQARIDGAVAQSQRANAAFQNQRGAAARLAASARGAAVSSEAWVAAQTALSALIIARSPSVEALADLDNIYLEQLDEQFEPVPAGGLSAVNTAREKVSAEVTAQQNIIDSLSASLR